MNRVCEICRENEAVFTCKRCGRSVCGLDFDVDKGICLVCRDTSCYICGDYSISLCAICGRPVCRRHSIRVGLKRVCQECAALAKA